ncbi:MAG: VCBS repeat-containing protein [Candidatus Poribacteria bacterium]|nr:VCBS repeat-containing protein [Candidatus Poribacteria bacterium]
MINCNLFCISYLYEKQGLTGKRIRYFLRSMFYILIIGVCLSGCSGKQNEASDSAMPMSTKIAFDHHEVVTGTADHQTVLTGFFLGNSIAELAVVNINQNNNRLLRIYVFDNSKWVSKLNITLRPEILFVDVANINGHDRLIAYEHGRLYWIDLETATEHILVNVSSDTPPPNEGIPHVDITRDVNGDVRDDLVVPNSDGFWVFIQMDDGTFANPIKIGPPTDVDILYRLDGYRHTPWDQSRIHQADYNRDGRSDLVFWNGEHFEVYHQNEKGLFSSNVTTFTTDVVFDSDDLTTLAAPEGVRYRRKDHQPLGNLTGRVLHTVSDMNGDGVADLGVFSLKGGNLWHMHSTYEVYFGIPTQDGSTTFASQVSTSIASDGIPFGLLQQDFDGDGQTDIAITTINPNVFKAIGMIIDSLLTHSGSLDFEIYRMEGGTYPDKPNDVRKIRSRHPDKTAIRTAFPPVLLGDVNGNERLDLLVGRSGKHLRIFRGVQGEELFSQRSKRIAVTMPTYEEYTWLANLNNDKKRDILMYHASSTEPNRLTILISQ